MFLVNRMHIFNRFDFNNNTIFSQQINPESFIITGFIVDKCHRNLPLNLQAAFYQLMIKDGFINGLQQSGSQRLVNQE